MSYQKIRSPGTFQVTLHAGLVWIRIFEPPEASPNTGHRPFGGKLMPSLVLWWVFSPAQIGKATGQVPRWFGLGLEAVVGEWESFTPPNHRFGSKHRCPCWLVWLKNTGPWFYLVGQSFARAIYFPKRTPMAPNRHVGKLKGSPSKPAFDPRVEWGDMFCRPGSLHGFDTNRNKPQFWRKQVSPSDT